MGRRAVTKEQKAINKRQDDRRRAADPHAAEHKRQYNRDRYQERRRRHARRRNEPPTVRDQALSEDAIARQLRADNRAARRREDRLESDAVPEEETGPHFDDVANYSRIPFCCIETSINAFRSRR